jgi:hypothetical protein
MIPQYYLLADGRDIDQFAHEEITPYLGRLDKTEAHFVLAALEYLFRQGRKPRQDAADEQKQLHRWQKAKDYFLRRMERLEPETSIAVHARDFDDIQRRAVAKVVKERDLVRKLEGARK